MHQGVKAGCLAVMMHNRKQPELLGCEFRVVARVSEDSVREIIEQHFPQAPRHWWVIRRRTHVGVSPGSALLRIDGSTDLFLNETEAYLKAQWRRP